MSGISKYSFTGSPKPEFIKPDNSEFCYAKEVKYAASVDEAKSVVDKIMGNLASVESDLRSLLVPISELANNWNNCIIVDNTGLKYVGDEVGHGVNNAISSINDGIAQCDKIFSKYSSTIDEINSYMELLSSNNEAYSKLEEKRNSLQDKISNASDDIKSQLQNELSYDNNLLSKYKEIDYTTCGKWVDL